MPKSTISVMIPDGQSIEIFPTPKGTSWHTALANPRLPNSSHQNIWSFDLNVAKYIMEGIDIIVRIRNNTIMYTLKLKNAFTLYPSVVSPFEVLDCTIFSLSS